MQLQRPITSGSRQAPDPYDQYLEGRGLYRKHTARDASSLFRVIAEQLYDTQSLHYEIRLECIRFMTQRRRIFEKHIRGDFDTYIQDMSKPKTYGTITELRAMCYLYRRNAILFEPYNMGTSVIFKSNYQNEFRVFYNHENHFDSIYKVEDIETAAVCQSFTFKMLYKMLFKLPDVNFAVETMLHPQTFTWNTFDVEVNQQGYMIFIRCSDSRCFALDLPETTNCILEDYRLCNFHSSRGIQSTSSRRDQKEQRDSKKEQTHNHQRTKAEDSTDRMLMCPNKMVSCVRQLLDDGITPFPYKVAKSLDPYMYRNIEFDCWNDIRKEAKRYNSYCNDYNFQVGAKCQVEMEHEPEMLICHIQKISLNKISSLVFVEKFGKKILVPYESLHPVPPDEFLPWTLPYRYQRQVVNRMPLPPKFISKSSSNVAKQAKWKKANKVYEMGQYFDSLQSYMSGDYALLEPQNPIRIPQQQQQGEEQQQTGALLDQPELQTEEQGQETKKRRARDDPAPKNNHQQSEQQQHRTKGSKMPRSNQLGSRSNQSPDGIAPTANHLAPANGHIMGFVPLLAGRPAAQAPAPWPNSPMMMPDEYQFPHPGPPPPPPAADGCVYMPYGGYAPHPQSQPHPNLPGAHPFMQLSPPPLHLRRCIFLHPGIVEPRPSLNINGEDLPTEINTLRYFYNIGVDAFLRMSQQPTHEELHAHGCNHVILPTSAGMETMQQKLKEHQVVDATPPPTPDAGNAGAASSEQPLLGKSKMKSSLNQVTSKYRGKRPEQLHDLKDSMAHGGHVFMLPTPTPTPTSSPTANGGHFSYFSSTHAAAQSPQPQSTSMLPSLHLMSPSRLLQPPPPPPPTPPTPPPPIFFHKTGSRPGAPGSAASQIPYAWGVQSQAPSSPMVGPFEIINKLAPDSSQQSPVTQGAPQLLKTASSIQSQAAAAYGTATRHH
ncbi:hypothetical protein KR018_012285 [Drosophila ironensis]|nr:hypothetical protein KR018_012285 [Drosophila ironensis]